MLSSLITQGGHPKLVSDGTPGWFFLFRSWHKHGGSTVSKYNPLPPFYCHLSILPTLILLIVFPWTSQEPRTALGQAEGTRALGTRGGQLHRRGSRAGRWRSRLWALRSLWRGLWWAVTLPRRICLLPTIFLSEVPHTGVLWPVK